MIFDFTERWKNMTQTFGNELFTALILVLCIPVTGFLIGGILRLLYRLVAGFAGNRIAYFIFNRLTFIGVFHHELSHAVLATITGAQVTKIVFFHPEGDRLGYVQYVARGNVLARSVQQTMTSIAPVFCGAITAGCLGHYLAGASLPVWEMCLLWYVEISVVLHMTMSTQDFKVMWKGIPAVYLLVLAGVVIFRFQLPF